MKGDNALTKARNALILSAVCVVFSEGVVAFNAYEVLKDAGVIQAPKPKPAPTIQPVVKPKLICREVDYVFGEPQVICEEK